MKKYICILITLLVLFVSCGKKEEPIELGPDVEWTQINVEELVGTEIYCSYESLQDFVINVAPKYIETNFYGNIVSIGEEPYVDPATPYGDYIEVGEKEGDTIRVYCDISDFSIGDIVYVAGSIFADYDGDDNLLERYYINGAIIDKEGQEKESYLSCESAIKKMDRLYKETTFITHARVRTASRRTYRINITGDYSTTEGEMVAATEIANEKYNGEWCKIRVNYVKEENSFLLYNTEIIESEKD
ncbi:MAG: hypothetical protein E7275_12255 [Pseudobutyrivibrio sp.]|uniref:hypothetical protein n=1 Tax=Pseudobutyrivibrio sp. TaxID=2014367 RepID=UPI0025EF4670|nr:hypothetical protein [Pseudobutyrivibrio sp.]MBE5905038.1 hypothetical protein [Pseudobutyrivibrio sp.]